MTERQADSSGTPDILQTIVAEKRREVEALRPRAEVLRGLARQAAPARDFRAALAGGDTVSVISEVKRRSPGAGEIRPGLDPARLATRYAEAGASALSVLTDGPFFGGSLEDLRSARDASGLPALRKDFTLDPLQIDEARAAGADCILLIVRILDDPTLRELHRRAEDLGMAALVEVHDRPELERALEAGASLVGINNRDLSTFETRLEVTEGLRDLVPQEVTLVSESGIRTGEDVARLGRSGVHAVLVGESLLVRDDPGLGVEELAGHSCVAKGK